MQPEHTPGPWHVEKSNGRFEIWPPTSKESQTIVGICQRAADAKAAAAAPDLLAFAQMVMIQATGDLSAEAFRCYVANHANVVVQRATGGAE
jgi:hypothetical protein